MTNYDDLDDFAVTSLKQNSGSKKTKSKKTQAQNGKYTSKHVRITQAKQESSKNKNKVKSEPSNNKSKRNIKRK